MKSTTLAIEPATASALNKAVKDGYVLLTRAGKPVAYVLPSAWYDEEDIGYMTDPEFWKMIESRRKVDGPTISLEELEKNLGIGPSAPKVTGRKARAPKRKAG
jgi:hypothetical protein